MKCNLAFSFTDINSDSFSSTEKPSWGASLTYPRALERQCMDRQM